jgi:hypothetical protein
MAATMRHGTKTITVPVPEESSPAPVTQGKPADGGRFRLQVDRQTKASYATWEAAEKAGLAIKARRRGDRVEMLVLVRCMSPWRNIDFTRLFSQLVPNRPILFQ